MRPKKSERSPVQSIPRMIDTLESAIASEVLNAVSSTRARILLRWNAVSS
ncbi:hypothetical protein BOO71_0011869 [Deinococcus marmoris]|uniref:Uncharacterized protein n=1 Tax=Deinococcus marmoris TaxID=249408 RepID=A0A1U7NU87_9DEIO|nr:hypothetical protein BOO71_0011869 [Deinococcus marmoris]